MKKQFDWKMTAKKAGISLAMILIAGSIALWQENHYFMVIVPLLVSAQNILKHKFEVMTWL